MEPVAGDDVKQSLEAGHIVNISTPRTIADGQQTTSPGEKTFAVIAEELKIPLGTALGRMRLATKKLREALESTDASESEE